MRIVFFGTPNFSAHLLEHLLKSGVEVALVVTRKDKPKGRNLEVSKSPVKELAESLGLSCFSPDKVSEKASIEKLREIGADLFVVVAFGEIVSQEILNLPSLACINVHTSLLPKYRGAAPIQRAIMDGEVKTGVTIMHMVKKMDAGDIISQKEVLIEEEETFGGLEEKLLEISKELLLQTLLNFKKGKPKAIPQNEALVTYAAKIELEDCKIDWKLPLKETHNLVRGVNPYPGAWTEIRLNGKLTPLKIWLTKYWEEIKTPLTRLTIENNRLLISSEQGTLEVLELQLPGKKRMRTSEWLRGARIQSIELV
ncbi:methionyl-tRNA formyltransferase [Criblamydia sequanensis]|uniref:Methionyl-tRNA formyltransferase n=1 Tax=Candidatus Criblamydia sequanensis CRIB-18 TaxID=1437425 RepID=A0A090CXU6_9BACT|nr:methionyl-tRNA formyltransferase [Criblamydia sequanensis]CDR33047.1 Methionyl-tRNA formyltransferase [Criblamydia sequanensis CRIB-18]